MSFPLPLRPFYLVRHGESEANVKKVLAGWSDTPLTEKGRAQAQELADCIGGVDPRPDCLVHSGLSRARDTGLALNKALCLPVREHIGFNEIHFGDWVGKSGHSIFERLVQGEVPPRGESMTVFTDRIFCALADVLSFSERPLVAAHGGVFDALAFRYCRRIEDIENCGLYSFEPAPERPFPWRLWHYKKEGQGLRKIAADHCLHLL